jgi:hypothetical protein
MRAGKVNVSVSGAIAGLKTNFAIAMILRQGAGRGGISEVSV